jgi:hypothetical protein
MSSPFQAEDSGQTELHPGKNWYLDLELNQKLAIIGRVFYRLNYQGAGEPGGTRTRTYQIEGLVALASLHTGSLCWRDRRDLNSHRSDRQSDALPIKLQPRCEWRC